MKRRLSALLLALCLVCALAVPASAAGENAALQAVRALGIVTEADTSAAATRADFAKMLTAASNYKDSVGTDGAGYSLFKDVKSTYWASEYIRLAIQEGWMTGYTDGTFRPDQGVTLDEACSATLKLLGYDSASLAGSFPSAQLNKAAALGLRSGISKQKGQTLTVSDCAKLFYNLMTAKTNGGQLYGTTLGYTVTNGELDYASAVLDSLSGPYIADSNTVLPFTPTTIYRDGEASKSAALSRYDIYYYNASSATLWIYTDKVYGEVTSLSPNSTSPTSVTVSGQTYQLSGGDAAYQLSELGGGGTGKYVTLLLGMDNAVAAVLTGEQVEGFYYGLVQSSARVVDENDGASVSTQIQVLCTDGYEHIFTIPEDDTYKAGRLVSVSITQDGTTVKSLTEKSTSGKVSSDATKLGGYKLAENVRILDTSSEGDGIQIKASRLAGILLSSGDVRWYGLNTAGEIEDLILDDVTGDTWTYGYMTSVEDTSQGMTINVSYSYLIDGTASSLRSSTTRYPVSSGGIAIRFNTDNSTKSMKQLQSVSLTALSGQTAMAGNQKYDLADDVQVYLQQNGSYYLTDVSAVNAEDYTLTGWYDHFGCPAGGQVRVIIARAK